MKGWKSYNENDPTDGIPSVDFDSGEVIKPAEKPKRHYREVYEVFKRVLGKAPANWIVNKTQQQCAENLYTERGLEQIEKALRLYQEAKENLPEKDLEFAPQIASPFDLDSKWSKLHTFIKKYG